MFSTLVDCGGSLQNHLETLCNKGELLDVREISASHATNVIASGKCDINITFVELQRLFTYIIFISGLWN